MPGGPHEHEEIVHAVLAAGRVPLAWWTCPNCGVENKTVWVGGESEVVCDYCGATFSGGGGTG